MPEKGISPHVIGEIVCLQFAYRIKFSLVVLKQIKQFAMQGEHDRNPLLKGFSCLIKILYSLVVSL